MDEKKLEEVVYTINQAYSAIAQIIWDSFLLLPSEYKDELAEKINKHLTN